MAPAWSWVQTMTDAGVTPSVDVFHALYQRVLSVASSCKTTDGDVDVSGTASLANDRTRTEVTDSLVTSGAAVVANNRANREVADGAGAMTSSSVRAEALRVLTAMVAVTGAGPSPAYYTTEVCCT
jgi:hypothetical protein